MLIKYFAGQMVYRPQSIFSFFRREFYSDGPVQKASLVAPEAQRYTTPEVIGLINGLFSLIKYGLSDCYLGFGTWNSYSDGWCRTDGDYSYGYGKLEYSPSENDVTATVDELATLLTAGRLNEKSRALITKEVENMEVESGLILAQQLISVSPEFHSTNLLQYSGKEREFPVSEPPSNSYKAIVYLFLDGGMDSFNLIVPHSGCSRDMYSEYAFERGVVALSQSSILQIDKGRASQVCDRFGVHPQLPRLKTLYDDKDLLFFANVGVLFEPVTKDDWEVKTATQLFAHNVQAKDSKQVDPFQQVYDTGFLGRISDVLTSKGYKPASFSLSGQTYSLTGEPGKSAGINYISPWMNPSFNENPSKNNMKETMFEINKPATSDSGFFGQTWTDMFTNYVEQTEQLGEALEGATTDNLFPETDIGLSLQKAANIMKTRDVLGNDRHLFYVNQGGWDSHLNQATALQDIIPELNAAIDSFVKEIKAMGLWNDVVLVCASEFGRTLTSNSGSGTDHGWGGKNRYFAIFCSDMHHRRIF